MPKSGGNFHERQQRLVEITPELFYLLTLWPWASYLISLGFNFMIYRMQDLEDKNPRTLWDLIFYSQAFPPNLLF